METLQIKPSKKVGEILEKLFNQVVEKELDNERESLLEKLKEFKGN